MPIDFKKFDKWFTHRPYFTEIVPEKTALVIVDMTYISAHEDYGVGEILKYKNASETGRYFYDRVENTLIPNQKKLADFFRKNNMPVIYLTFSPIRKDGKDLYPLGQITQRENEKIGIGFFDAENEKILGIREELEVKEEDMVINKLSNGAFYTSSFDAALRNMGITTLFFAGVCTNMCVESTAREAVDRGYNVILIDDATATYKEEWQRATCEIFEMIFGTCVNTEDVIADYPWTQYYK